jgi:hypothetical protein
MRSPAQVPVAPGVLFHPARLALRTPYVSSVSPGYRPLPVVDGLYIATNGQSMTDEPVWLRVAGHLEEV